VEEGASIGANATIIAGNRIGRYAMIGAGSVVTKDVPDHTLWFGNPARLRGYVCYCGSKLEQDFKCTRCGKRFEVQNSGMKEVL
jgi:serine acetyltransferase